MPHPPTALIAEDEPLLAQTLAHELQTLWPTLHIQATASDGLSAVQLVLQNRPDLLFFDIRMPGLSGLEAAAELADVWPPEQRFPLLVFVTAYDQYAVDAFQAQAVDYVLKPVRTECLAQTVARLQSAWQERQQSQQPQHTAASLEPVLTQLRTPLKELMQRLDPQVFWQIHRGSVVRASAIASVSRDESGRLSLNLKHHPERLRVSRLYAYRFKAM